MKKIVLLALLLAGCATATPPSEPAVDAAVDEAIAAKRIPGAVLWIEHDGEVYHRAYGNRAVEPAVEPMTADTIFDVASITKVVATAPSIAKLIEQGKVSLDAPVRTYLPEFADADVTVRHLLTHTSGIRPGLDLRDDWSGYDEGVRRALAQRPLNRPGTIFRYSDVNYILLGEIVRRVSGETLDTFARRHVFEPLGMFDTGFRPAQSARIAPTENGLRGVVHDPTSRRMGGVAGHAGLFTTAADLAKFARWAMTSNLGRDITPEEVAIRRAFGFDIDSAYSRPRGDVFPYGSFGHTGWTGGFLWIDPSSRTFYVFLSNRVHPDGKGSVIALQRRLGTVVAESAGVAWTPVPRRFGWVTGGGDAQNGIDVLHATNYEALRGMRIGLITNQSGIDRTGNPTVDLLRGAPGVTLAAIFTPEHGLRGTADDERVADEEYRGIPVISLYNERRKPAREQLANLDALVFDIQDIGTRFYTYISTMGMAMEAAAEAKVKFIVLDRVNPIGGDVVEGPLLEGEMNFIGWHPLPVRHGKTVGELAQQFREERRIDVDLTVVPVKGWSREQWQDEAGLPWVNTSPNMRSLNAAALYPGIGLLERAISVGRGTPTPFEILGAPYIDGAALIREVGPLPGLSLEPVRFTPDASIHKDQECGGVRIAITDRRALRSVDAGVAIASVLARLYPQFPVDQIQPLLRHRPTLKAIRAGKPLAEIKPLWGIVVHGATVIDGGSRVADVVMRGDRIERVDDSHQHEGFRVIDATGQFVIPGLIDMHAHLLLDFDRAFTDQMLRMFLAHGVTTVRDPGSHLDILPLRAATRAPRILTAGPILIGSKFVHPDFKPVSSEEEVRAEIRAQAKAGVDFIKVYASMTPDLVKAAIDEAHAHGLPILGHLQRTTWAEAARLGIDGIEHAAPWSNDLTTTECPQTMQGRICWIENLDLTKARATARVLAQHRVVVDPTLIAMQTKIFGENGRDLSTLPPYVVDFWRKTSYDLASGRPAWPKLLAFTRILHEEGVTLVAGTDTPTPWILPGASLHEELQFLHAAGIPAADVLKIATRNAAHALRRPDLGTLTPGKRADLVILAKNPLEDIANTRSIVHVLAGGE